MGFRTRLTEAIRGDDFSARLEEAGRAYSDTLSRAAQALRREDIGWSTWVGPGDTMDVVPLESIKDHSVRARRLAAYNPLVKRGITIRNAYMWSELPETTSSTNLAKDLVSLESRCRDESALCTDGIVIYLCDPSTKKAAPVPLSRVVAVARSEDAASEGDLFAFLILPVPTSHSPANAARKPVWYVVDGQPYSRVQDSTHATHPTTRAVYASVNRQVGEEWGKPDLMGAVYWAKAYKEYLEAAHTMSKALARIAFRVSSMSSKQQQSVISQLSGAQGVGGIASLAPGQELTAVSKSGAGIEMSQGTPLAAMVSAALDVPLSVLLTDGSAGGRQGAETALEDPTFKAFELRRQIHAELIRRVLTACGIRGTVTLGILSNELIQRWGQVLVLMLQNGVLWPEEVRSLALRRFSPTNAKEEDDLPEPPQSETASTDNTSGNTDNSETGVGPLSDGTNANRDEQGGETVA